LEILKLNPSTGQRGSLCSYSSWLARADGRSGYDLLD
jgi:hypothetical protein